MKLELVKELVAEHGTHAVLGEISSCLEKGEKAVRDSHDQILGSAFDILLAALVETLPTNKKGVQKIVTSSLLSQPVRKALIIRGADKDYQSPAVRAAFQTILSLPQ